MGVVILCALLAYFAVTAATGLFCGWIEAHEEPLLYRVGIACFYALAYPYGITYQLFDLAREPVR